MPVARQQAVKTCRFCDLTGHIITSCTILKAFGTPVSLERWDSIKATAPQGSSEILQIIMPMPLHSPFPKEVKHLLMEAVLKTSAYGNVVVQVSGINSLASKILNFQSQWRDGSLFSAFLGKHNRSDEGGRRSIQMIIASRELVPQSNKYAATLPQEAGSSFEPCVAESNLLIAPVSMVSIDSTASSAETVSSDPRYGGFTTADESMTWVSVPDHGEGLVMFVGLHHVDLTPRVGVKLNMANGLNNGTIRGHCYFTAAEKHGILTDPVKLVRIIHPAEPAPAPRTPTPALSARICAPMPDQYAKSDQSTASAAVRMGNIFSTEIAPCDPRYGGFTTADPALVSTAHVTLTHSLRNALHKVVSTAHLTLSPPQYVAQGGHNYAAIDCGKKR